MHPPCHMIILLYSATTAMQYANAARVNSLSKLRVLKRYCTVQSITSLLLNSPKTYNKMPQFEPGSLVLTKIKGFPPWPSMILPDDLAPATIVNKKPKSGLSSTKLKKEHKKLSSLSDEEKQTLLGVYLVKFFHDDTYQWAYGLDLVTLAKEKEQIDAVKPKRMSKGLEKAFTVAANVPPMEEFAQFGSYGKPDIIIDDDEEEKVKVHQEEQDNKKPVKKIGKLKLNVKGEDEDKNVSGDEKPKRGKRKAAAAEPKNTEAKKKRVKKEENPKEKEIVQVEDGLQSEDLGDDAEEEESVEVEEEDDDDEADDDNEDIIDLEIEEEVSRQFQKDKDEITKLEAKYDDLVDDSNWPLNPYLTPEEEQEVRNSKLRNKRQKNATQYGETVAVQTTAVLNARRILANEAIKPAAEFDVRAVEQAANKIKNVAQKPLLRSVAVRCRIAKPVVVMLRRSDLGGEQWTAVRDVLVAVHKAINSVDYHPVVVQENYVV